jgi:endo-1,4-beta-mannosidase
LIYKELAKQNTREKKPFVVRLEVDAFADEQKRLTMVVNRRILEIFAFARDSARAEINEASVERGQ